jgi:hypothetical protein
MSEWISVKDKLPEISGERLLAYGIPACQSHEKIECIEFCIYNDRYTNPSFIFGEYECVLEATHWMPLPNPPVPYKSVCK